MFILRVALSQEEADERYLQLSGGKVTGPVEVPAPAAEGQAATKGYVDGVLAGKLDKTATAAAATKLATASDERTSYRVMERLDERHVRILIR